MRILRSTLGAQCEAKQVSKKSFLLALDGSQEAMYAAEIAWQLAELENGKVVAQTVVDSQAIWQYVGKDLPGIIGNSPYLAAYEAINSALRSVAETLLKAYDSRAQGHKIESETVLDEGNTVAQIVKRAAEHSLVVIGHRGYHRNESERQDPLYFPHYSLAEHLAYYCPKPLLIIQDKPQQWKIARLVVSSTTYDNDCLNFFLNLTKTLKLSREIFCIDEVESCDKFVTEMRKSIPASENVHVKTKPEEEGDSPWECAVDVPATTLLIVTTQVSDEGRKNCEGKDLGDTLAKVRLPALLILPEQVKAKSI